MNLKKKIGTGLIALGMGVSALTGHAQNDCSLPETDRFQSDSPRDSINYLNRTNHVIRSVASLYSGNVNENGVSADTYNQSKNPESFEKALRDADANGDCLVNLTEARNLRSRVLNDKISEDSSSEYGGREVVRNEESEDRAFMNYNVNDDALNGVAFLADFIAGRPVDVKHNGQNNLYSINSVSMRDFSKVDRTALSESLRRMDVSDDKHITKEDVRDFFVGNNFLTNLEKADAYGDNDGTVTSDEVRRYNEVAEE